MPINPNIPLSLKSAQVPFVDLGGIRDRTRAAESQNKLTELGIRQKEAGFAEFEDNADLRKLQGLDARDRLRVESLGGRSNSSHSSRPMISLAPMRFWPIERRNSINSVSPQWTRWSCDKCSPPTQPQL